MSAQYEELALLIGGLSALLLGIVILAAAGRLPESDKPGRRRLRRQSSILGWGLLACGLLAIPFFGAVILIVAALVFVRLRRARQQALLWTLAVAAERSLPLTPVVEAFADERSGGARHDTLALARLLKSGVSLPDALAAVGGLAPDYALATLHVGQELGAMPQGLRQATAPAGLCQAVWQQLAGKLAYLCFLCVYALGIIIFLTVKIMPAFQKIFADFGAQLPAITRYAIAATFGEAWPLVALGYLLLLALTLYAILRYLDVISWELPLIACLARKLHAGRVLESLAMAVERDQPLVKALAAVARCYPRRSIRRRLQVTLVEVAAGADWIESFRSQGLISRADVAVLRAAQRAGNLAWAMREVAESHRRRLAYQVQAWIQVLFPVAIVCSGLMVLALVAGYFLPLAALIQKLV